MKTLLVTLFCIYCSLLSYASLAADAWREVIPTDFPTVERLFSNGKCEFTFPAVYLFDTRTAHWLSAEEAKTAFPHLKTLFESQQCEMPYSAQQLAELLNLNWPSEPGLTVLFFEPPTGMLDVFFQPGSSSRKHYDEKQALVAQLNTLPRYRILTPMTGLKSKL